MEAIDRGGMATSRQPAALALPAPLSVGRTIALWPGFVRRLAQRLNMRLRVVASVEESGTWQTGSQIEVVTWPSAFWTRVGKMFV